MKDGVYKVIALKDAGLNEFNGKTKPFIRFALETDEGVKELTWYGDLVGYQDPDKAKAEANTEKAVNFTIKSLVTAGFIGNDFADLAKPGSLEMYFNQKDNLTVTVKNFTSKKTGEQVPDIKYINEGRAKKEFTGVAPKFASIFAQVRKDMGVEELPF